MLDWLFDNHRYNAEKFFKKHGYIDGEKFGYSMKEIYEAGLSLFSVKDKIVIDNMRMSIYKINVNKLKEKYK